MAKVKGLYKTLREIEDNQTPEVAEKYFYGLLEDSDVTYDEFLISIIGEEQVVISLIVPSCNIIIYC